MTSPGAATTAPEPRPSGPPGEVARTAIGVDVGGTGVKAGLVDLATGELHSRRIRRATPKPATPEAIAAAALACVDDLVAASPVASDLPAGCGLPGVVKDGRLKTATNLDKSWLDAPAQQLLADRLGRPVAIVNDADAAGLGEMTFGAGRGQGGTVLLLTIGTGIGSALFVNGRLVPNTELGVFPFHGRNVETLISGASRERRHVGWKRWARDFSAYIAELEACFWPDLIILGGGISKEWPRYGARLVSRAPIVPALLLNSAGIVGAAMVGDAAARAETASLPHPPAADRVP
ncbi:MAG: polyphosphate--glucose phosphotransferase [Candidatus Limnocylindrales bacterium]